jgi:hypothetical protein
MAAAALRSAATKVCGRAFERPNSYFTTALKEEQRRLLQRISHGRSSLRRFSSSESPNLLNNNKVCTLLLYRVKLAKSELELETYSLGLVFLWGYNYHIYWQKQINSGIQ